MAEKPMLGGCCVCLDERGWAENPLVYCDGQSCNVAVHQACYGIVKVPSGPWFCRKCESQERAAKVKCELCPHRDGALKRTDGGGWAHVVCALYIPEVTFGSVSSMEPIILFKVPPERFNKTCYICEENSRSSKAHMGACMTCAKQGCKASFHVTCAQMTGLLCEEASGGNQTKYCGYCKVHLAKVKKISSYKSLSCTKVYRLPMTSSSDELTSPERMQDLVSEASIMKPGDIRYTKAGKKRSKSLEESHNVQSQNVHTATTAASTTSVTAIKSSEVASTTTTKQYIPSSSIPIVSVEPLSVLPGDIVYTPSSSSKADESKTAQKEPQETEPKPTTTDPQTPTVPSDGVANQPPVEKPHGLTLSSLAEAASALSSADAMEEPAPMENAKPDVESVPKKSKSSSKDSSHKSKKERKQKSKKEEQGKVKKKDSKRASNVNPHKPVPPTKTKTTVEGGGIASFPRHGVVSLAEMGMDRTETYGPLEIGDNNKIITPNMSVDGLTALERLLEEQKRDTMEFFREYGTTPDVAALLHTLHKVRDENSQLQSAIDQMTRRRDQLLLIKTRVSGLRTKNISDGNNSSQSQAQGIMPPVHNDGIQMPQSVASHAAAPIYTSVTTK